MSENNLADKMKETASATFDEIENRDEKPEGKEDETVDEAETDVEDVEKDEEPEEPDEPEDSDGDGEGGEEPEEDEPVEEAPDEPEVDPRLNTPPTTWKPAAKSKWKDLDPEIRAEIRRREDDAIKGITNYKEKAEFGDRMDKTIQPYRAFLNSMNVEPDRAVNDALNFAYTLRSSTPQQRSEMLLNLAEQYGADMELFSQKRERNPEVEDLKRQLREIQQSTQTNLQQTEYQQSQQVYDELNRFANETDESGGLKHPYFDDVNQLMASILETGQAQTLEDAYEIAVKAHPDTSKVIESEQARKAEEQRQKDEKKRQEKAEKNSKLETGKKPRNESSAKPTGSMRETIEQTYDEIMSR